jgi:drug/metabolite transporter (DMT)-like permease
MSPGALSFFEGCALLSIVYGLASALTWGAADFIGGFASRRSNPYGVVIGSEATGGLLFCCLALALGEPLPALPGWLWGCAAGVSGGTGLVLLFIAFSHGKMSAAAPIAAVVGAIIPVVVGAVKEGFPGITAFAGILLALAAVWLISRGAGNTSGTRLRLNEVALPALAGIAFGMYFISMHQAGREGLLWPIGIQRLLAALGVLTFALISRQKWLQVGRVLPMVVFEGILDVFGNSFFVLSGLVGRLDTATVLSSLYPAVTVLLAVLFLKEHFTRLQLAGTLLALLAIVLLMV